MFKQTLFSFHRNAVNLYRWAAGFSGLTLGAIKPSKIFLSSKLLFRQHRLVNLLHNISVHLFAGSVALNKYLALSEPQIPFSDEGHRTR